MTTDPPDEGLGIVAVDEEELESVYHNGDELNLLKKKEEQNVHFVGLSTLRFPVHSSKGFDRSAFMSINERNIERATSNGGPCW